jgi:ABC-2 type transport system ATP-binding protein
MIEARGLTKRYGTTTAVDDLSFRVESGRVTGFLGPNGAGKSTTMRMVLGLDQPDAGGVRIDAKRLVDFPRATTPPRTTCARSWAAASTSS